MRSVIAVLMMSVFLTACSQSGDKVATSLVAAPKSPECIAPAKPGGGFELTCQLAQTGFKQTNLITQPMTITHMPGGVGAIAYNKVVTSGRNNGDAIVAFSTGSLLNLAQGKFGKHSEKDVKWLAAVGVDYGAVAVSEQSPYYRLEDLVAALKKDPRAISFGAGGSVGGQDWLQTALLAKAIGVNPSNMSYTAMEGGGEAVEAVLDGQIQVVSAGLAELMPYVKDGKIRVLAVFAPKRFDGDMSAIPTAKEQGYEIEWPVIRGYYMAPEVDTKTYQWWKQGFDTLLADPGFGKLRESHGLQPFAMTGDELEAHIGEEVKRLRELSAEYKLIEAPKN